MAAQNSKLAQISGSGSPWQAPVGNIDGAVVGGTDVGVDVGCSVLGALDGGDAVGGSDGAGVGLPVGSGVGIMDGELVQWLQSPAVVSTRPVSVASVDLSPDLQMVAGVSQPHMWRTVPSHTVPSQSLEHV